jgi:hypothetical protein
MANPTSGFQLSALPQPLSIPSNLGKFDVGETQQAYANALKNAQQTALLAPQTQAAIAQAGYQKGLAEQQSRLLDPEEQAAVQELRNKRAEAALKARGTSALTALPSGAIGSAEQLAIDQAAAQGATAQGMAEKGYRILDSGNGMKFIQTDKGITSAYPAGMLSHGSGDTLFDYIGEALDDPNTGQKKVKVRPFTLNALGQKIYSPITEVVAGSVSYQPTSAPNAISAPATTRPFVAAPRLPQSLGSFTAPAIQTIPQGGLINQVKTETGLPLAAAGASAPQAQVTPAAIPATPTAFAPEPLIKPIEEVPHTQGSFGYQNKDNQVIWAPGKDANDSIKNAIAKGIPAVVDNPNYGLASKSLNANDLKNREESRKEMQGSAIAKSDLQRSRDTIGRELNIGENITTFSKIPLIGGIVNDFRKLFQPDLIALDKLATQAGLGQAKGLVGSRVAVQEMQNIIGALGDANTPAPVRKELAMSYLIGNQNQEDYLTAKQKYYDAYKITNGFDGKWEQYTQDNPIGKGTPGAGYSVNDNRIPWDLYNILKNKGYTNPNQTVADHPDLLDKKTGNFDYNKLDNTGNAPWTSGNPVVKAAIVNPQNPVSGAAANSGNVSTAAMDAKAFILDFKAKNPNAKEDEMRAAWNKYQGK